MELYELGRGRRIWWNFMSYGLWEKFQILKLVTVYGLMFDYGSCFYAKTTRHEKWDFETCRTVSLELKTLNEEEKLVTREGPEVLTLM